MFLSRPLLWRIAPGPYRCNPKKPVVCLSSPQRDKTRHPRRPPLRPWSGVNAFREVNMWETPHFFGVADRKGSWEEWSRLSMREKKYYYFTKKEEARWMSTLAEWYLPLDVDWRKKVKETCDWRMLRDMKKIDKDEIAKGNTPPLQMKLEVEYEFKGVKKVKEVKAEEDDEDHWPGGWEEHWDFTPKLTWKEIAHLGWDKNEKKQELIELLGNEGGARTGSRKGSTRAERLASRRLRRK